MFSRTNTISSPHFLRRPILLSSCTDPVSWNSKNNLVCWFFLINFFLKTISNFPAFQHTVLPRSSLMIWVRRKKIDYYTKFDINLTQTGSWNYLPLKTNINYEINIISTWIKLLLGANWVIWSFNTDLTCWTYTI